MSRPANVRLGRDLEEYAPELSANVEKKANILGQTHRGHRQLPRSRGKWPPTMPRRATPLFEKLQAILDGDLVLDDLKTDMVEVKALGRGGRQLPPPVREECYIEIVQLRRRHHRLPDPLQRPLHRRQDQGDL